MSQGNNFAYIVLIIWPLIAIYLYKTRSIQVATLWTILGGYMWLPVRTAIDFPMIPPFDKQTIPALSALLACTLIKKQSISIFKKTGKEKYLLIFFIITPFIAAELNQNAILVGNHYLKGLTLYDGLSMSINQFLLITPFLLGRQMFKRYEDQVTTLKVLVIAGLIYSIPILFEVRMSPQLHSWLYGYFPHSFAQQYRYGGFRPVVFMGHGLLVAFFAAIVAIAAVVLAKNKVSIFGIATSKLKYYFLFVLLLCKTMGALMYGLTGFILIQFFKPKIQLFAAVSMVTLALSYPFLSMIHVFPHQAVVDIAYDLSPERAESLEFRFKNENILLDHAQEHFYFGWGGWGRNRVFDDKTGKDESVTDGRWIITFGQFGLFGFIAEFGLLAITVFRAKKAFQYLKSKQEQALLAAQALMVGVIMIDQLPNASLQPWLWLLAGILLGRSEMIIAESQKVTILTNK